MRVFAGLVSRLLSRPLEQPASSIRSTWRIASAEENDSMDPRSENRSSEEGFSIIEGLIATALLLIVTVGILPLFTRSMANNLRGNVSTRQANGTVDEFERLTSLPFNTGDTSLLAGASRVTDTVIALKQLPDNPAGALSYRWEPAATLPPGDRVDTLRRSTLRQFPLSDFNFQEPESSLQNPVPLGLDETDIHLKVIDIEFFDPNRDAALADPDYAVRLYKGF
jgi:hypothetical protein